MFDARGYQPLVVAQNGQTTARLGDVALVVDGVQNDRVAGWADQQRAVLLIVRKQPDANIIETNERVLHLLPELATSISPAIDMAVSSDRTQTIRASVNDVEKTLGLSVALVIVVVVFAFLRVLARDDRPHRGDPALCSSERSARCTCCNGCSIDNLSLMALTISTGFVVDDAIVVTENITRALERGKSPVEAALEGAQQIGFTIVSITASLLAVFVPILLMGGIVGRLFREFAVTLSVAVAMSALVSLTLTPMMCSRMLKAEQGEKHGWFYRSFENAFEAGVRFYERGLRWALAHRVIMLIVTFLTVAVNIGLFVVVPKGLFPQQDTGLLIGTTQASQDASYAEMVRLQTQVNKILSSDPDVDFHFDVLLTGSRAARNGQTYGIRVHHAQAVAAAEGDQADREVLARLRGKLSHVEGIATYLQSRQDVNVGGRQARTQYQYTVEDANLDELQTWAPRLLDSMRKLPQLKDLNSDQQNAGLQLNVDIDRDTASRLGVTAQAIDDALYDAYGQRLVATTYTQMNEYYVVMEAADTYRQTPDSLGDGIYVKSVSGAAVPLRAIAKVAPTTASLIVNHNGQFPAITLSFNLSANASLGEAVDAIHKTELDMHIPPSVHADFQGTAQAFTSSLKNEPLLIMAALLAVYIVLGMLYESYLHPVTILSTLPSAGIGALVALMLFGAQLDVIAIVESSAPHWHREEERHHHGQGLRDRGGPQRRYQRRRRDPPRGAAPLPPDPADHLRLRSSRGPAARRSGTASGPSCERRPLGITIVGGLLVSQLLTLYTTPVVYLTLERLKGNVTHHPRHARRLGPKKPERRKPEGNRRY